jgi:hypothetical protein
LELYVLEFFNNHVPRCGKFQQSSGPSIGINRHSITPSKKYGYLSEHLLHPVVECDIIGLGDPTLQGCSIFFDGLFSGFEFPPSLLKTWRKNSGSTSEEGAFWFRLGRWIADRMPRMIVGLVNHRSKQ